MTRRSELQALVADGRLEAFEGVRRHPNRLAYVDPDAAAVALGIDAAALVHMLTSRPAPADEEAWEGIELVDVDDGQPGGATFLVFEIPV